MRHFVLAVAVLLTAACATTPTPVAVTPVPAVAAKPQRGELIGLTPSEIGARFGKPRLQVREGDGTKVQFSTTRCVLDLYLYPAGGSEGVARVTHVDARTPDGRETDKARCLVDIETR